MTMYDLRKIAQEANLCIVLDNLDNFKIIKNRSGMLEHLEKDQAVELISKIMFNTFEISDDNPKLFIESIKEELLKSYEDIFEKYKIKKYSEQIDENINFKFEPMKISDLNGTGLRGYLDLTYDEIKSVLGEPTNFGSGDDKIDWHWILKIEGVLVHIYNYKDGPSYLKDKSISPSDIERWHVGGKEKNILLILNKYFKSTYYDITTQTLRKR